LGHRGKKAQRPEYPRLVGLRLCADVEILAEALFRVPKHPLMLTPKAGEARRGFGGKGVGRQARAEVGPKFLALSAVGVDPALYQATESDADVRAASKETPSGLLCQPRPGFRTEPQGRAAFLLGRLLALLGATRPCTVAEQELEYSQLLLLAL